MDRNDTHARKSHGEAVDELLVNARRLAVAHAALGVASAFNFLSRPGIFHPSLRAITRFRGGAINVILHALLAWLPYLISWAISRAVLSDRDKNATLAFIACATGITIMSFGIDFPVTGAFNLSALIFSGLIAMSLAVACGACAKFWRRHG